MVTDGSGVGVSVPLFQGEISENGHGLLEIMRDTCVGMYRLICEILAITPYKW